MLPHVVAALAGSAEAQVIACASQIGSGSLPVDSLPSAGIAVSGGGKRRGSFAERIATAFRSLPVPVIGHIRDGAFVMDLRCLDDETGFIEQLRQLKI